MISKKVSEKGKERKNEKVRERKFTNFPFNVHSNNNFVIKLTTFTVVINASGARIIKFFYDCIKFITRVS